MRARRLWPWMLAIAPICALAAEPIASEDDYGFFDFLGEMVEDGEGEWVDPLAMEELADYATQLRDEDDGLPMPAPEDEDDE
ncbi:MAG: hypothetical protein AAFY69_03210 [Pseudomonadota bacterium]